MKSLSLWTHPITGQQRVYCNAGQQASVWAERDERTMHSFALRYGYSIHYRARSPGDFPAEFQQGAGTLRDMAYSVFAVSCGLSPWATAAEVPQSWDELLGLARQ